LDLVLGARRCQSWLDGPFIPLPTRSFATAAWHGFGLVPWLVSARPSGQCTQRPSKLLGPRGRNWGPGRCRGPHCGQLGESLLWRAFEMDSVPPVASAASLGLGPLIWPPVVCAERKRAGPSLPSVPGEKARLFGSLCNSLNISPAFANRRRVHCGSAKAVWDLNGFEVSELSLPGRHRFESASRQVAINFISNKSAGGLAAPACVCLVLPASRVFVDCQRDVLLCRLRDVSDSVIN